MAAITKFVISLALISMVMGCGGAPDSGQVDENSTAQATAANATANGAANSAAAESKDGFQPARPPQRYDDPRAAVRDFLNAVRSGEDKTATSLLSTPAQEEAWKNGMAISAQGFPQAEFVVSEVEYLNENREAHVMSVWSDVAVTGEKKSFECVWLLALENHGWTVYGMASKFLDDMDPVILNFENQAEMMQKQQWAEQQIAARYQQQAAAPTAESATQPVQQASHTVEEQRK